MLKNITNKIFTLVTLVIMFSGLFMMPVLAQVASAQPTTTANPQSTASGGCAWLGPLSGLCTSGSGATSAIKECQLGTTLSNIVTLILNIFFFAVLAFAVYSTLQASIKYIRSEGNEKMVGEAKAAMRSILLGVGAMFICVIFILIIQGVFSAGDADFGTSIDEALRPVFELFGICS